MKNIVLLFVITIYHFFSFSQSNHALVLNGAYVVMNGGTQTIPLYIVVNQPHTNGIVRNSGHIHSENQYNYVRWNISSNTGSYVVPFGVGGTAANYIPLTFNKTAGNSAVDFSTWSTDNANNPLPGPSNVAAVNPASMTGNMDGINNVIDRFWDIQAPGGSTADLTFSYLGTENTTQYPTSLVNANHWNGTSWDPPVTSTSAGVTSGIGTAGPYNGQTGFSPWALSTRCSINLTSPPGTDNQTVCIGTPIVDITYNFFGSSSATITGLPAGVTSSISGNSITISGTPSVSGSFPYTITLTGGCSAVTATGTITVNPNNTITLTSAPATTNQTVCINSAITNITYSSTGATGATFSGLPTGVTGNYSGGNITISGTPTVSGTFNYTVTLTGGCGTTTATGTITVTPNNTITLTSAAGTDNQTVCINSAITNITYSSTGATGATFSGLPTGVTGNYSGGNITISGTPTVSGTFNYTVTLTGGCGTTTATGTITVTPNNTITLTSAAGTDNQTVCINSAITNITYSSTGATGATFSGLPTGVTGNYSGGNITISGTPTVSGTFNYTVTLTGGCGTTTATGTITVTPNNTITLTSAAGTNNQTVCINSAITNITYSSTGATGATFSGLPTGVTGNYSGGNITISGTPTVSGTFNYTVTLTGGCGTTTATGTITVTPNNTITLTSAPATTNQTVCINSAITNITYSSTGATGATFSGLPTGVTGNYSGGNITISGTPTVGGTYNYTVTLTGGCGSIDANGTIDVISNPGINIIASPSSTICQGSTVTLGLSGTGTGYNWNTGATTSSIVVTPSVNTTYTVTVTNPSGCVGVTTATLTVNVVPVGSIGVSISSNPNGSICAGSAVTLTANGGGGGSSYQWSTGATSLSITETPANTTTYTVTVTDPAACSGTAMATVSVNVVPAGSIGVSISSNPNGAICAGSAVTLTANGGGGGSSYQWSTGASGSSITDTPTNTTTYTVTVTDPAACSGTATATVSVNVVPVGSIGVNISSNPNGAICAGSSVTLTANGGGGGSSYQWSTGASGSSITDTPTNTTTYTVTVTDPASCSGTATATVSVNVVPVSSIGVSISSNPNGSICAGSAVTLTANGGGGGSSYQWSTGATSLSITETPANTTTYTVTVSNPAACSGTATATVSVNVVPVGSIGVSISSNPNGAICAGSAVTLTANGGGGGSSYQWSTGASGSSITDTPANTTTYTVTVTDPAACSGTATATVSVNVVPSGSIGVNISSNPNGAICAGTSVTLTANGGAVGSSYLWNTNANSLSITVYPNTTSTYTVTVTNPAACSGTATATITVPVSGSLFSASIQPSALLLCAGDAGTMQVQVNGGSSPYTYNWTQVPAGYTGNTTGDQIVLTNATLNQSGSYVVQVSESGGCSTTATAIVIVSETGAIAFSNAPVCEGEDVELFTVSGATSYQWIGPNGFSSTQQNPVISNATTSQSGVYTVAVNGGNCSGTATVNVQVNPSGSPVASIQSFPGAAVCSNNNTVILVANQGNGYIWSNGATTQAIQVNPGSTNTYTVTVSDSGGCGGTATASMTIEVGSPISASISSSGDVICPGESVNLTASLNPNLGGATYSWNNGQSTNSISVNVGGTYSVIVTQQGCSDTVQVVITLFDPVTGSPIVNSDIDSTQINTAVSISVQDNDSTVGSFTIIHGGNHGSASINGNNIDYTPNLNYTGWDTLRYVVCSTVCSNVCDTAEVYVYVIPKTVVLIPGILTPNQDGYNDGWVIGGIEAYPDHRVTILNRWGDVVFEASPYNNDWVGQCNTGLKLGGDKLPRGTYYYVVYLGEGEEIIKGFVELTY